MLITTYILAGALAFYVASMFIKNSKISLIMLIISQMLFFGAISKQGIAGGDNTIVIILLYVCGFIIALQLLKSILILLRGGNNVDLKDGMMIINSKFIRKEFDTKRIVHVTYKEFIHGFVGHYILTLNNGSVIDIPNKGFSKEIKEILDSKLEEK